MGAEVFVSALLLRIERVLGGKRRGATGGLGARNFWRVAHESVVTLMTRCRRVIRDVLIRRGRGRRESS